MPGVKQKLTNLEVAQAFVIQGLEFTRAALKKAKAAGTTGALLAWLPTEGDDPEITAEIPEWESLLESVSDAYPDTRVNGLRLVASLAHKRGTHSIAAIASNILGHPGFHAAAKLSGYETGLASFAIDPQNKKEGSQKPALSWPLKIFANPDVLTRLKKARAVERGLAVLAPQRAVSEEQRPHLTAAVARIELPKFHGQYLALSFYSAGGSARPIPHKLNAAYLSALGPTVFLPIKGNDTAATLTAFVYEISHNLPIDLAAWNTVHYLALERPPLVVASRRFLDNAQISSTIPKLQTRLRRFSPRAKVPITPEDITRFGFESYKHIDLDKPVSVSKLLRLLDRPKDFLWDHESDAGEGLLAVMRATEALEGIDSSGLPGDAATKPPGFESDDLLLRGGDIADATETLGGLIRDDIIEVLTKDPIAATQRYTDIRILDGQKDVDLNTPLVDKHPYILDVAIRVRRRGLTLARRDQAPVEIPRQTETETVWVVISDESVSQTEADGGAFKFDIRFGAMRVPVTGDSENSARFSITPTVKRFRAQGGERGRIGIRLYHKLNLIDHVELDVQLETTSQSNVSDLKETATRIILRHPGTNIESLSSESATRALTISICTADRNDSEQSGNYRIAFAIGKSNVAGEPVLSGTKRLPASSLDDFVTRFRIILLDLVFGASLAQIDLSADDRDDVLKALSILGTDIVTRLFDYQNGGDFYQLGQMISDVLGDASIIQISLNQGAEDFVFPWQILTVNSYTDTDEKVDPLNLWGYRFVIEVKRSGDGVDTRLPTLRDRRPIRISYGHWHFANEAKHQARLREIIGTAKVQATIVEPIISKKDEFIEALKAGGGDLFYIYAHGHSAVPTTPMGYDLRNRMRQKLDQVENQLKVGSLLAGDAEDRRTILEELRRTLGNASVSALTLSKSDVSLPYALTQLRPGGIRLTDEPIVFLNTCESAALWNAVNTSFVGFFLSRGARAVIGSESTIPVILADVFGCAVLREILGGRSLGDAVLQARLDLLRNSKNPLGLCYSVYGDANARLWAQ